MKKTIYLILIALLLSCKDKKESREVKTSYNNKFAIAIHGGAGTILKKI